MRTAAGTGGQARQTTLRHVDVTLVYGKLALLILAMGDASSSTPWSRIVESGTDWINKS
jgi:hypothetical protein